MSSITPPFRYDIVGSFQRPSALLEARSKHLDEKTSTREELTAVEDEEVKKLVAKEVELGLHAVTDGEFRRAGWLFDFHFGLKNINPVISSVVNKMFSKTPIINGARPEVVGNIEYNENHPFFDAFLKLKNYTPTNVLPKVCIPSPAMLFNRIRINPNSPIDVLPPYYNGNKEKFFTDLSSAYNKTIKKLYDLGLRYLQIDNCAFGNAVTWYSDAQSDEERKNIIEYAKEVATIDNLTIANLPADLTIALHICRGNYKSDYFGRGAYDSVAEQIASIAVNGYFLEYDDERSGGFGTLLTHIAKAGRPNVKVVLGLLTSKRAELEDESAIIARIEEAAKYYPKELLCLSCQCGFASMGSGANLITLDEQWAKLEHVIKIAKKVWSDA